jgi:large subunit ribosomal protein L22e
MPAKINKNPQLEKTVKYNIDLGVIVVDELVNGQEIVDYLKSNIKIDNLKGNIGSDVAVALNGSKHIVVSTRVKLAKRYIKYLIKKALKKIGILEYLKVNATEKNAYKIKYLKTESQKKE